MTIDGAGTNNLPHDRVMGQPPASLTSSYPARRPYTA